MFSVKIRVSESRTRAVCVSAVFTAVVMSLHLPPIEAQHRHDYRGIDARTFNPGRGSYASPPVGGGNNFPSGFRTNGNVIYGQPGLVQQFGGTRTSGRSSATYSNGHMVA